MGEYPTEEELARVESWPNADDFEALMEYVKSLWWAADWGWSQKGRRYYVSTGGWSGNEDLIGAMGRNFVFWVLCWESSRRGGHYRFKIPPALAAKGE